MDDRPGYNIENARFVNVVCIKELLKGLCALTGRCPGGHYGARARSGGPGVERGQRGGGGGASSRETTPISGRLSAKIIFRDWTTITRVGLP